jgi:hypothetical protein
MALTTHPYPALRLKKEQSYTSTPSLGPHGLFYSELNLLIPVWLVQDTMI